MPHRLYEGSVRFAWHARRWPEFDTLAAESPLVILPVYSLTDWAMDRPLDAEELVGASLLDGALARFGTAPDPLVLPPFRFTPQLSAASCFGMDIESAHRALEETVVSAARSGLQRFVLFNTSPLLEEWIDVAARDIRISRDLQMFCLNLSGVGLDFHPVRGGERAALQSILTHLTGQAGEAVAADVAAARRVDPQPGLLVPARTPMAPDGRDATELLAACADHLAALLREIAKHPPLQEYPPNPKETE